MLNVKQCDVTPIIVQCAKDCNKKFDVNSVDTKPSKNNNTPKSSFQSQFEKLKKNCINGYHP